MRTGMGGRRQPDRSRTGEVARWPPAPSGPLALRFAAVIDNCARQCHKIDQGMLTTHMHGISHRLQPTLIGRVSGTPWHHSHVSKCCGSWQLQTHVSEAVWSMIVSLQREMQNTCSGDLPEQLCWRKACQYEPAAGSQRKRCQSSSHSPL